MDYITIEEAVAHLAGRGIKITGRWVRGMAMRGDIDGAKHIGEGRRSVWLIPADWAENWNRQRVSRKE